MNGLMGLVVLATSIWMAHDSSQLDYDKRDVKGLAAMGPAGWFFCGLLLWIVTFPLYLVKRGELKAAGERRRQLAASGYGHMPLPPAGTPYGAMPPTYGQAPGFPPQYGATPMHPQSHAPYGATPMHPQSHPPYGAPPSGYGAYGVASPQAPSPAEPREDIVEQILKLDRLRVAGILTDDEFERKKADLLARS